MKVKQQVSSLLALALTLAAFPAPGFATTLPLNEPGGLALDAAGNLYVANVSAGQILIYNSSYAQTSSITQGINFPTAVAIDLYGNLWVGNAGSSEITEYTKGKQITSATISIETAPDSIAIDGPNNLWLESVGADRVTIYSPVAAFAPPSKLVQTIQPSSGGVRAIAVGAGTFLHADSGDNKLFLESASASLLGEPLSGGAFGFSATALAPDSKGNFYGVNGRIVFEVRTNSTAINLATLPSTATLVDGIAVDTARGRVYISDINSDKIFVYSTAGKLLHTIHN